MHLPLKPLVKKVQSDSESSSPLAGLNSATEISTDSEFEQDPVAQHNADPSKQRPTRVQVKQSVIENGAHRTPFTQSAYMHHKTSATGYKPPLPSAPVPELHIEFKPLVQVDPSVLTSSRIPLRNPRPGDYMLNKTSSTEGIASKKSLELKKRYLLGEQAPIGGLMKSDSTSMLDSKFKNFHSSISTSSKLLSTSPTAPGIMHSATTIMGSAAAINKSSFAPSSKPIVSPPLVPPPSLPVFPLNNTDQTPSDEKENVHKNANQNESHTHKPVELPEIVPMKLLETINSALVESKFQELVASPKSNAPPIETIDLITPDRTKAEPSQFSGSSIDVRLNKKLIRSLSLSSPEVIDLTDETVLLPKSASPENMAERSKNTIDSMLKNSEYQRTTQPPEKLVDDQRATTKKLRPPKDHDADSLSSASDSTNSSTSSIEDIPHFVLDSTTSPDTLPAVDQYTPNTRKPHPADTGDMMQIDSLMIIDGKYVGDPEDLKHMAMPICLDTPKTCATAAKVTANNTSPIIPINPLKAFKYESVLRKKPDLKFDTRNENKIETLKNMPIRMSIDPNVVLPCAKPIKPTVLPLKSSTLLDPAAELVVDLDKTPTAPLADDGGAESARNSDSDTEVTGQLLTETELSDWAADDAVSENFVDIEFALNSNKGTIRRNKKKKKHQQVLPQQQSKTSNGNKPRETTPTVGAGMCPIAKDMELDGIEFMDTGSEDSCMDTYSATNQAMLRNRGYVQFVANNVVDQKQRLMATPICSTHPAKESGHLLYSYKSDAGYGSSPKDSFDKNVDNGEVAVAGVDYIEQGACVLDMESKTPMNESMPVFAEQQPDSIIDIDEDSLVMMASSQTATTTTTTDSEALTIVTSPVESIPTASTNRDPSSADTTTHSAPQGDDDLASHNTNQSSSLRSLSREPTAQSSSKVEGPLRTVDAPPTPEDMPYEDYVRKLQLKISQISHARDSIDIRKTKRKHLRGELPFNDSLDTVQSPIATNHTNTTTPISVIDLNKSLSIFVNTTGDSEAKLPEALVEEPQTVTERIEEISKERAKQKDLIHDLVMDKLQSKKQMNAEKRLNRSRNRSSMFSPPMTSPAANLPSIVAHHQVQHAKPAAATYALSTKPSALKSQQLASSRPTSELYTKELVDLSTVHPHRLTKTQSFCTPPSSAYAKSATGHDLPAKFIEHVNGGFSTPVAPPRRNRQDDTVLSITQTEKLRQDARARARLKSSQDLGLSPDEKLLLLRKRFHLDEHGTTTPLGAAAAVAVPNNKSDDMKVRERKMMASKSVNDIASVVQLTTSSPPKCAVETSTQRRTSKGTDYKSETNLTDATTNVGLVKMRRPHPSKDPDRRKSIIQAVSDFFHKKKELSPTSTGSTVANSPPKETRPNDNSVFGRFRISPKAKSKDKLDHSPATPQSPALSTAERSRSEDPLKNDGPRAVSTPLAAKSVQNVGGGCNDDALAPPIPPLPTNYQRSDDESCSANETRDQRKSRAHSKAIRQAELKRLRIAQEIQREQEEIEVKLKDLEARGVLIEKALRGEGQNLEEFEPNTSVGANDDRLMKELLEIWRNITQLKKRDDELGIRQQELQLEHRHAQLKDQLNTRLSCSRLDKSSSDVAAEGAILNEMLEIVAKRAALRSFDTSSSASSSVVQPSASDVAPALVLRKGSGDHNHHHHHQHRVGANSSNRPASPTPAAASATVVVGSDDRRPFESEI